MTATSTTPTTSTTPKVNPLQTTSNDILNRNLAALAVNAPHLAAALANTEPATDIQFVETTQGALSATYRGRALASKRRPLDEADRIAAQVDPLKAGGVVVLGFGLGHHVAAIVKRMREEGLVFVFEPDLPLLRAALERIDHSGWLGQFGVCLLTDADDSAAMSSFVQTREGLLAIGVKIIEHAPSTARLGESGRRFTANFTRVFAAVRTVIVTTMVQMAATFRNGLMNLDHYVGGAGVADLKDKCAGFPAIVVAAGPSLARNIAQLANESVRQRCVIIAVQTALKPLLAAGVKPHFVVSLDYHEISKRFYEGLTQEDVEGVTLVVEPKANAVVADTYPGRIRCAGDGHLDMLLGEALAGDHGAIPAGSTVAHLAYYLARHLACDPVMLVGQDLGFTDGQYYAAGAAIHSVWAGELNPFNTLEMLEWERISRGRRTQRQVQDHLGRPIYTDEQMSTYLAQFERDFLADERDGKTVIDATEGGVAKAHTQVVTLAAALSRWAPDDGPILPDLLPPASDNVGATRKRTIEVVERVRKDTGALIEHCVSAQRLIKRAISHIGDNASVNPLIQKVYKIRDAASSLRPAYDLAQRLNQTGGFNRARADRALRLEQDIASVDLQQRQLERDVRNLEWLEDSTRRLADLLDATLAHLRDGAPKRTRDPMPDDDDNTNNINDDKNKCGSQARAHVKPNVKVAAVVAVDLDHSGLGVRRDLAASFLGKPILRRTVERLARCRRLDAITLLTSDVDRARAIVGDTVLGKPITFAGATRGASGQRAVSVARARLWSPGCWRGGVGNLTCYDEVFDTERIVLAMRELGCDSALVVGGDWMFVDPALCDALIERHAENPSRHRFVFTQATPGFTGVVIANGFLDELAQARQRAGVFASIGGAVGYLPVRPAPDPIASSVCVAIPDGLRDCPLRCVADSQASRAALERALAPIANAIDDTSATEITACLADFARDQSAQEPRDITLEITTKRIASGRRLAWAHGESAASKDALRTGGADLSLDAARALFEQIASMRDDAVVTLAGAGDPLLHEDIAAIVAHAKDAGVAGVHVRTDLLIDDDAVAKAALDAGCDVMSVDLLANTAQTYEQLTGVDRFDEVKTRLLTLLRSVERVAGLPARWIFPRITRCDAVYTEIEPFFDEWIMRAGWAVIDQLPALASGERIEPLPRPALAQLRDDRDRLVVRCDGCCIAQAQDGSNATVLGDATHEPLDALWRKIAASRQFTG